MPFDLSTARKVAPTGFDLSTAKSADRTIPRSPPETRPRAAVEEELRQREADADATQRELDILGPIGEGVRAVGSAFTSLAKGNPLVGLPAMAEDALEGMARLRAQATPGSPDVTLPRVFRGVTDALSPPELEPRNATETFTQKANELLGGAGGGTAVARQVAKITTSPVARAAANAVADMPGRQAIGAGTGAAAGTAAHEAGANPLVENIATLVGGAAPFVGANGGVPRPTTAERLAGTPSGDLRAAGFKTTARQAETDLAANQVGDPVIESVPGSFSSRLAHPAEIDARAALFNARRASDLAGQDIGLSGRALTPEDFAGAAAPHNAVYDEVVRMNPNVRMDGELITEVDALGAELRNNPLLKSSPEIEGLRERLYAELTNVSRMPTQNILDAMRVFRARARKLLQSPDDPAKDELGFAYKAAANALENSLERTASLDPALLQRFKEARTQLAKIHNVEDATVAGAIDPQLLAKLSEKYGLSGNLGVVADLAQRAPDLLRHARDVKLPMPDYNSLLSRFAYPIRRQLGEHLIPRLLSEDFQSAQYGASRPGFASGGAGPTFPPPPAPIPGGVVRGQPLDFEQAPNTRPVKRYPGGGVPFEDPGNVMPPQSGRDTLTATPLADSFDALPPAEAQPGDLTAEIPPAPEGQAFSPTDLGVPDSLVGDLGLEIPPSRFTGGPDSMPFDQGLDFTLSQVDPAPIVRGGAPSGGVTDSLLTDELLGRPTGQQGVPFDEAGLGIGDAGGPAVRPAGGLGDGFGTGFGEPPASPLLRGPEPPLEGEWIQGVGPYPRPGYDPYAGAVDAELADFLRLAGPDPASPEAPAAALSGPPNRPRLPAPAAAEAPLADELTVADEAPRAAAPDIAGGEAKYAPPEGAIVIDNPGRQIVLVKNGDRLKIDHTSVDAAEQNKGLGQQNLVDAVYRSIKLRKPLDSDSSFRPGAWRAWKAALKKGLVEADNIPYDAIEAAFQRDPGRAVNPTGEPWITDIRLGPAG